MAEAVLVAKLSDAPARKSPLIVSLSCRSGALWCNLLYSVIEDLAMHVVFGGDWPFSGRLHDIMLQVMRQLRRMRRAEWVAVVEHE